MNKAIKVVQFSLILIWLCSCSNKINLQRKDVNNPVIIRMNEDILKITGIKFPFEFEIENKSFLKRKIGKIIYEYGYEEGGVGVLLYFDGHEINNNGLKVVRGKRELKYFAYSRHFTDSTKFTQKQLAPYVAEMLKLNQDTLCIGTVSEFKENHAELFKMLTENDTISIRYLKDKNSGLGERIAIPANW